MIIRNVSRSDILTARVRAAEQFDGNIILKRFDQVSGFGKPFGSYRVTLTVADSRRPGARRSPRDNRRIAAACWHAHGAFMDALPPQAVVISSPPWTKAKVTKWSPGDAWVDYSIGSPMYPCMASEACEC